MPHKVPPPAAKGTRTPGSGRQKGTPNRVSVEVRELVGQLVNDVGYQHRLREDFRARKVHPTIEALIWTYHLGKPRQDITLTATVDVNAKLEAEKRIFATLDVSELEGLAMESQALMDKATALAKDRQRLGTPQDVVCEIKTQEDRTESLEILRGSDNADYVKGLATEVGDAITPDDSEG